MKANYAQLSNMSMALRGVVDQKIPVKAAYWLNKAVKEITDNILEIDKKRLEMLKGYAESDDAGNLKTEENGEAIFETPEDREEFMKALNELYAEEVNVEIKHKITLGNLGTATMSARELDVLKELFNFESEETEEAQNA